MQIRNAHGRFIAGPKSPISNITSNCPTLTRGFGDNTPADGGRHVEVIDGFEHLVKSNEMKEIKQKIRKQN